MSTLHGSWILHPVNSYFFVWGETWRTINSLFSESQTQEVSLHPFNVSNQELVSALQSLKLTFPQSKNEHLEIITLPSQALNKGKPLVPLLSTQMNEEEQLKNIKLQSWQVKGIVLNSFEAVNFLASLPIGIQTNKQLIGEDLRYWGHIYRWNLDLLVRGKFLPGVFQDSKKIVKSCWYPLLDSTVDQARLAKFIQVMPMACRAYSNIDENEPQNILLDCLRSLLDAQVRRNIEVSSSIPKNLVIYPWLQSLSQTSSEFVADENYIKRLNNALYNWTLPLQDYVVTTDNSQLGKNQFRVCLILQPPEKKGEENWQLTYNLQALDNIDFIIDAQSIWRSTNDTLVFQERKIEQPQESLLKGLGLASRLYEPIENSLQQSQPTQSQLDPIQVYEFIRSKAWQLQNNGLGVILPNGLEAGSNEKRIGIKVEAGLSPKKGERLSLKSLLNYQLKLIIGEQVISQKDFDKLLAQKSPVVEVNGQWIALQPTDVKAAQAILNNSHETINLSVEDALRLSTGDKTVIAKLPVVNFEASGVLKELIDNLTNNQSIQLIETPKEFKGKLRPYQLKGVSWLAFLEKWGLGACLADDMGLGKTPQLIAFLLHLKTQDMLVKPTLVICPTSVLNNWEREVQKFAPTLSTLVHHGDKRKKGKAFAREIQNKALIITSYPLAFRDEETLKAIEWQGVVLDEAQNIKNPQAKQSQAVRQLKAEFRITLTGTPVENRLSELWSILDFLNPGFLGTKPFFQRRFAMPIEKYGDRESLNTLRSLVRPFILRRMKTDKEIIQDLPEKQEMNVYCGLSQEQATIYQIVTNESLAAIEDSEGIQRRGLVLTLLMKLKQICNHPAHFLKEKSLGSGQRSGKLLRLEEMLEELVDEGDRALIFTQFSEWGKLLKPYLQSKLKREVLFLYGSTKQKDRQAMIDQFQNDPNAPPIFILSLKAGGTGLNLTRANHVFHIDRWWNPAVENQATDRAFRIGQKRNVQVHKFICTGTLEERINDMIESKKQLAEQTVDAGEQWLTELDTNQLRNLLLFDRDAIIDEE